MADKPLQKIDERLKDVHTTDLTEGRINEDFLEWLKTKGPQYLLLALIGVCVYLGLVRWKQYKVSYYNNAWSELVACDLPGCFEDVAELYADVPGLPQQALRSAADRWLAAVQTGTALGGVPLERDLSQSPATRGVRQLGVAARSSLAKSAPRQRCEPLNRQSRSGGWARP